MGPIKQAILHLLLLLAAHASTAANNSHCGRNFDKAKSNCNAPCSCIRFDAKNCTSWQMVFRAALHSNFPSGAVLKTMKYVDFCKLMLWCQTNKNINSTKVLWLETRSRPGKVHDDLREQWIPSRGGTDCEQNRPQPTFHKYMPIITTLTKVLYKSPCHPVYAAKCCQYSTFLSQQ